MVFVLDEVHNMSSVMRYIKKGNQKHLPGVFINYLCTVLLSTITLNSKSQATESFFRFY